MRQFALLAYPGLLILLIGGPPSAQPTKEKYDILRSKAQHTGRIHAYLLCLLNRIDPIQNIIAACTTEVVRASSFCNLNLDADSPRAGSSPRPCALPHMMCRGYLFVHIGLITHSKRVFPIIDRCEALPRTGGPEKFGFYAVA